MSKSPILTNYVSEIDQLLQLFDQEHPELSNSQRKEHHKALRVSFLRDKKENAEPTSRLWEGF